MRTGYSTDEQHVIRAIAVHIRQDRYKRMQDDYIFDLEWSEILTDGTDVYERLIQALESLRKRNFDSYSAETTTLNGYIMKAKISRPTEEIKLLISADLVLQLLADYKDDYRKSQGPAISIEELKELVRVG